MRNVTFHQNDNGLAGIEFAIMSSIMAMIFIAAIDLGMGFFRRMQVQTAAQRGAVYASIRGFDPSGISSVITAAAGNPAATPTPRKFCGCPAGDRIAEVTCGSTCTVSGTVTNAGVYVEAGAQTFYTPILKFNALPATMTFQSTQIVRVQ